LGTIKTEVKELKAGMENMKAELKANIQTVRTEMNTGITRLETTISIAYVLISFRYTKLTSVSSEHNSRARNK
jgi:hypothetical protein